jgi:hypothetical protein
MDVLRAAEMRDLIDRQAIVFGDLKLFESITICSPVALRDREERRPNL